MRRTPFATRTDADLALFAYMDGWYNTRRIQRTSAGSAPTNTKRSTTPINFKDRTMRFSPHVRK
ncbi:hypothetical protein [Streptomyces sp. NRRL S-87]|uniref:hypothetical protein n=1 Tax=Streptomyces sp. NRRL S-87 TaxID=1463920 RepID=UPI00131C15AE|nr:hypothetical protein [Streptomyces sp. NRRL S-87]